MLREPREQRRPVAHEPGLHHELVLIDQSQLRQCHRELHASREQSLTRLLLELLNGLPQIPAHEFRVPIDPVQGARHDVLLFRVDRPGEGLHPIRPRSRPRRRPPPCLHHFVSHPAKEEGIGPIEVLDRVTMQVFVRDHYTMIAAPVQCDVDGIPKGSHCVLLKRPNVQVHRAGASSLAKPRTPVAPAPVQPLVRAPSSEGAMRSYRSPDEKSAKRIRQPPLAQVRGYESAAARITSITSSGRESIGTWLLSTSLMVAPMRFATNCWSSDGTVRSLVATMYQLGLVFQATPAAFFVNRSADGAK